MQKYKERERDEKEGERRGEERGRERKGKGIKREERRKRKKKKTFHRCCGMNKYPGFSRTKGFPSVWNFQC